MIRFFCFILFSFVIFSCNTKKEVLLFKETQIVDVNVATTIKTFPWHNDFEGLRDSIFIKQRDQRNEIYRIIKKLDRKNTFRHDVWIPRYAFLLEYNGLKDTLYYDNEFKEGYMVRNKLRLIDTNRIMKRFLLKNYRAFLEKEYW